MLLSVIILSFKRREALQRTLREIDAWRQSLDAEVIVVDNASDDGTPAMVRETTPWVRLVSLASNGGVAGFNAGAAVATGEFLLILDDDSWPDPPALRAALDVLRDRSSIGAVALLPLHPRTRTPEWPFATRRTARLPVMGCGNLVRAVAWQRVRGYEEGYFLYRNDTDLAMKLLGAGYDVYFDPAWVVWHDTPHAARKSDRWLELATRNWVWLSRRHGKGRPLTLLAGAAGVGAALVHAGPDLNRIRAVLRGASQGVDRPPPPLPPGVIATGEPLRTYLRLRWARGRAINR